MGSLSRVTHGMDLVDLRQARMKLRRSFEHLAELEQEQTEWFRGLPVFEPEWAFDDGWWMLVCPPLPQPPERLALVAGDVIQNARIALEYAASAVIHGYGGTPTHVSGFPMVRKREAWRKEFARKLPGVPDSWSFVLERYQPFTTDDRWATLVDMSNDDKHRLLLPRTLVITGGTGKVVPHPTVRIVETNSSALYGAELASRAVLLRVRTEPLGAHPDIVLNELEAKIAVTYWSRGKEREPAISLQDIRTLVTMVARVLDDIDEHAHKASRNRRS
jgi:hypothetical protein